MRGCGRIFVDGVATLGNNNVNNNNVFANGINIKFDLDDKGALQAGTTTWFAAGRLVGGVRLWEFENIWDSAGRRFTPSNQRCEGRMTLHFTPQGQPSPPNNCPNNNPVNNNNNNNNNPVNIPVNNNNNNIDIDAQGFGDNAEGVEDENFAFLEEAGVAAFADDDNGGGDGEAAAFNDVDFVLAEGEGDAFAVDPTDNTASSSSSSSSPAPTYAYVLFALAVVVLTALVVVQVLIIKVKRAQDDIRM
jgi:hypothetical protein